MNEFTLVALRTQTYQWDKYITFSAVQKENA